MKCVGPPLSDPVEGGIIQEDAGEIICHSNPVNNDIQVKYLGGYPPNDADAGGVT